MLPNPQEEDNEKFGAHSFSGYRGIWSCLVFKTSIQNGKMILRIRYIFL
jgi:hypothetical protein